MEVQQKLIIINTPCGSVQSSSNQEAGQRAGTIFKNLKISRCHVSASAAGRLKAQIEVNHK
jgi:hypothetical protein